MLVIKCPECGSYHVVKTGDNPPRFKCKLCHNKFSITVPLPNHKDQAKRIPSYIKARIMADHILGRSIPWLVREYRISKGTVLRTKRYFQEGKLIYVWRLNYDEIDFLYGEIERGILRQGWGAEGMDLRNGPEAFVKAWRKHGWGGSDQFILRRFNILKVMLVIKPGDYVIVPKLPHEHAFVLLEVLRGYDFSVAEDHGDYGHYVEVRKLGEFSSAFEDLEEVREGYRYEVQWINEMLRSVRGFYSAVAVVGKEMKRMYDVVEGLLTQDPTSSI